MAAYRWTWRTVLKNLNHYCWDVRHACRNLWILRKGILRHRSFDYCGFLLLMEASARDMRDCHRHHGQRQYSARIDRHLTVVSELCKRLAEDYYLDRAGFMGRGWDEVEPQERSRISNHCVYLEKQDAEYLGKMMRFVQWWWE